MSFSPSRKAQLAAILSILSILSIHSILALALLAAPCLQAQAGDPAQDDAPAMAMGSGRMVRGTVTAIQGDRIAIKTEAGESFTVAITPNTRVMKDRQQARIADIKVGDGIGAGGELDQPNKTVHALFISAIGADEVRKMKESFGKTWITGRITAIEDLKITILRSDKATQTIAVDEDTSFKRGGRGMAMGLEGAANSPMGPGGGVRGGNRPQQSPDAGEPITLADLKVGDAVAGQGALKNGVFVPTTLAVADPAQRRRRQPGASNSPAATAPDAAAKPQ